MSSLQARLQLHNGMAARIGEERVRLLEAIAKERSITAGARAAGMSFRGAWDAVQALNALVGRPLVETQAGGREGGLAVVTKAGEALILAYRRIDRELAHIVGQLEQHLADEAEPLDRLAWRLGMKTSARNQWAGMVEAVTPGSVTAQVVLQVADALRITAVITRDSAEALSLRPGLPAVALVKSSLVIIAPGDAAPHTPARNRLAGRVVGRRLGAVSDEVVLEAEGGVRIAATLARDSGDALALEVGDAAQALVEAGHVIIAVE